MPVLDYNTPGGRDIGFDYATDLADHAHVNTAGAQKNQHGSGGLSGGALRYARQARRRGLRGVGRGNKDGAPDAQNITLRFTLDVAEYFRLLMQDKDLAAVITTQGDATGSGSLRSARSVQAMGAGHAAAGTKAACRAICGGRRKSRVPEDRPGPLEYTLSWGGHDVTLRSAADNSSTTVDGEEQSRNRPGVNVLVYDKVLDRVIQSISFSTLHAYSGYTA